MESLLALAPSPGHAAEADGLWTAREVLGLDLPADLVTLSACNTGLGRVTGDGVLGSAARSCTPAPRRWS
jgi:CHAT domain-containing protein